MEIIIAAVSILLITGMVWAIKKTFAEKFFANAAKWICPLCLGVLSTWLGFLVAHYLGRTIDLQIVAIMMGGSVVGFTYYLEKKIESARFMNTWKTIFVVTGFLAVYYLLKENWPWLIAAGIIETVSIAVIVGLGRGGGKDKNKSSDSVARLKKQMEDCC